MVSDEVGKLTRVLNFNILIKINVFQDRNGKIFAHTRNLLVHITYFFALIFYFEKVHSKFPSGNYTFEVNDRNTRTRCEIYSKLNNKDTRTTSGF